MKRWIAGIGASQMTAEQEAEVQASWAGGAAKTAARAASAARIEAKRLAVEALQDSLLEAEALKPQAAEAIKQWAATRS